ncbi:putative P-loop containing nucleoside triphosphate hydrolase, leucine-rich repeat domain, L [Rosa chinensis]|uniref:Putative P-loop containing nucleoside triphosphate hydrolase, leucine-rich repeat domain, L n=1 Tax=Rosa chinensis TaxID=74649 RepID=A0A2P6QPW3_ROSCH|nr:putative disease resistance protein RGA3 [Rosa chinensis]XP_040373382.1 putative disease resistance protein RGA3 [Rosa chinensis]XP_040373383.1 putative disease resistance protein RGA3 [Rosa chinensis]XP_040373384.1 putative disease resistance protein RGA3 [Rosa chinensis]PRQ36222.1 putative P-loop containing nucleoside triphosphate hydrolase, leucine-rich repeat domain, L [Rosa chinensis]
MAAALVNVLLARLATLSLGKIQRELNMVVGVKQEVKNLTKKLQAIQAVLEDAEQRQEMEASVKLWLNELNDVSHDMDDVLDEWITRVLMHQVEKEEKQGTNSLVATKKKVCFPFPSSCFRFSQVNQLFLRHEIASKIKELNETLAQIDENKQRFNFQNIITRVPELPQRQKTTSLPNAKTFGRDNEKNLIISKLLSESTEGQEVPLVIPIVGMGGIGKTSLVNLVYNDEKIKSHFDERIWVCVSDPFEEIKIAKAIVEGLEQDNTSNELETLMRSINQSIEGKKFLLVLDDVWSPKLNQWEELIKPLCNGAMGSTVLVTTRKEEVATLMKATTQLIPLKALGEVFCLSLFYYYADINESSVSKQFYDIGLEIVKRCNGLPLAAKALGSLMRNKKKIHEWRAVLNSKTWELEEIQQDVFRPLLLSYLDLSPAIKRCLLYCATFPKDFEFQNDMLIELWMSQDYLYMGRRQEKIAIGQNYFDDLVRRSFFQNVRLCVEGVIACQIHDIVHDFLQYLTKNESLILDFELDGSDRMKVPNDKLRHLTLVNATESDSLVSFLLTCRNLRSFTIMGPSSYNFITISMFELIEQLKCLRALNLCNSDINDTGVVKIPKIIGGLIHLRYLDLSGNRQLVELSGSISSLYNLQTLRLAYCYSLEKIDVGSLINLMHLHVQDCGRLNLIKGIEKLTELQTLDEFNIGVGDEQNKLEDLKDLNQLQQDLSICICGPLDANMAEKANIRNKAHLTHLALTYRRYSENNEGDDREIMNALEPHPDLEGLQIFSYGGVTFSHWLLSLQSLTRLDLSSCNRCEFLPPLGKLPALESLHIECSKQVKRVGVELLGIETTTRQTSSTFNSFQKLKQLSFFSMTLWEEWQGVDGWSREEENSETNNITIMPCLSKLRITCCKKLKALPDFLWKTPLQELHIKQSPILENLYREGTGEQWAKISHISSIKITAI